MQTIHAIFENGIFRPTEPVELPDRCEVEITVHSQQTATERTTLVRLAEIGRQFPVNPELPDDLGPNSTTPIFTVYPSNHDFRRYEFPAGRVEPA